MGRNKNKTKGGTEGLNNFGTRPKLLFLSGNSKGWSGWPLIEIKMSASQLRIDFILTMFSKIVRSATLKKILAIGVCAYSGWKKGLVRTVT